MTSAEAAAQRFNGAVAIFYNPLTQAESREWDSIKEFNGPFHPLLGDYKCDDPAILRQHLHWLRRAGVDVIVYDIYGFKSWNIPDLVHDKALQLLLHELAHQDHESRKLKLVIWLEKYFFTPSLEEYRFGLNFIRDQLLHQDFYYRYHGAPLVPTYCNGPNEAFDQIVREYPGFHFERVLPGADQTWSYLNEHPQPENRQWMSVNPGFDMYLEIAYAKKYCKNVHYYDTVDQGDLAAIRRLGAQAAAKREDGRYFERQLLRAREVAPEIIFISGWNDWQCSLQIEPAVEYQFQYVDQAARLLGRQDETLPYRQS